MQHWKSGRLRGAGVGDDTGATGERYRVEVRDIQAGSVRFGGGETSDLPGDHPHRLHPGHRHPDVRRTEGDRHEEVFELSREDRAVGDLAGPGRRRDRRAIPDRTFHQSVDRVAPVMAGVNIDAVIADGDGVFDPWREAASRIRGEVMLGDPRPPVDAATLAHVNLPRPVVVVGKLVAMTPGEFPLRAGPSIGDRRDQAA